MRQVEPWHVTWMEMARTISRRSKDISRQFGSVVVSLDGRLLLGVGYNGSPKRTDDSQVDHNDRPLRLRLAVHSESNALWFAAEAHGIHALRCGTLFVTGKPCSRCVLEMARAELTTCVYDDLGPQARMVTDEEWGWSVEVARRNQLALIAYSTLNGG